MPNLTEIAKLLSPFIGGGLAGSMFTYLVSKRRERKIARLEIATVPYLSMDEEFVNDVLCYIKLTMKHCPQPVKHLEIFPKLSTSKQIQAWSSRLGLNSEITDDKRVKFTNLRNGDIVTVVFLTPHSDLSFDDSIDSKLVDINSEPHVFIQKTRSAWYV